jgi:pyruvate/2-oxoacid:ferredoxin oxidoreductase beta subunit/intein/homing endonuclease
MARYITSEEYLVPGHRACIGCGEALAVRLVCKALGENSIIVNATGCIEIISSLFPQTSWKVPWIHTLFENVGAVVSGIESAYKVRMRKGRYPKEKINFVGFAGDGGTTDIGLQALSGAMERGHDFLYCCFDNEAYMNCLPSSSLVMTEEGLKRIVEVKKGEKVYAFDQKSHELVLKRCVDVFDNGTRGIFELETLHHQIEATPNHPFLVLKRNGRGRRNELVWKTLSEIMPGDMIVVLKDLGEVEPYKFNPIKKTVIGDYKVTHLNEIELPEETSPDLMKYLGIYLGDGWTRSKRGEIGFALPDGSEERKEQIQLHTKIFGDGISTDEMYVHVNSVNLARFIDHLGFGSGARNKTIPSWIFKLPKEEKESFVEGLIMSDGYKTGNSLRYVSASKELLRRLRLLLQTMGYRVGKIHEQEKKMGTECVGRKLLKDSQYGYICFSKRSKWNIEEYPDQYKYQNFLIENEHFEMEEVKEVKPIRKEPVFDLRVEGEHNFIADGIVVHNTGIQRSGSTPYGAWTTTAPNGRLSIGQKTWKKDMVAIAAAHDIPYVATACPSYPFDLMDKVKRGAEIDGPAYIHILSPCPTGWRFPSDLTIKIGRLAVETGSFPLYELEDGRYRLNLDLPELKSIKEYLSLQGRFRHLLDEEIGKIQERVNDAYIKLKGKMG